MPTKRGGNQTREMVKRLALLGVTAPEIGRMLDISRQATHQHLKNLRRAGELPEPERASA